MAKLNRYPADGRTAKVLVDLLDQAYLSNWVRLEASAEVSNAVSLITPSGERVIVYRPDFLDREVPEAFVALVIAHELGHHIEGDTAGLAVTQARPPKEAELRADAFAAKMLKVRGYREEQIVEALDLLVGKLPASTPTPEERRRLILKNYKRTRDLQTELGDSRAAYALLETKNSALATTKAEVEAELKKKSDDLDDHTSWAERAGKKDKKKTVLESVVMSVRLNDGDITDFTQPGKYTADVEITYHVLALEDTVEGDLEEVFHVSPESSTTVSWVPSTEKYSLHHKDPVRVAAFFRFSLKARERRTIQTSARYEYTLPLSPSRKTHGVEPSQADDAFFYINQYDYINELVLVIRSSKPLREPMKGDALLEREVDNFKIGSTPLLQSESGYSVATFRWRNLEPRQIAGLLIRR
ncbi:hypothetical protein [Archangium primigenium]|uniref:hypothetical protein n=1 Tax=[Archangium] primigenium TaxID=2792470 RepID=UPI00195B1EE3|nr:hypothetical protein [Archangium primigenium]